MDNIIDILFKILGLYKKQELINELSKNILIPHSDLLQPIQQQDKIVDKNDNINVGSIKISSIRILNGIDGYQQSMQALNPLKNNDKVIRIMTYNIYEWSRWNVLYNAYNNHAVAKFDDIFRVSPTIVCLQEYNEIIFDPTKNDIDAITAFNQFKDQYELVGMCKADQGFVGILYNIIYIKRNSGFQVEILNQDAYNIGDIQRCGVFADLKYNGKTICIIANIHLEVKNVDYRLQNIDNALTKLNKYNINNKIILGDFNSYRKNDYTVEQLQRLKDIKGPHYIPTFEVTDKLESQGWIDSFTKFFTEINAEKKDWQYPVNTNRYGGRVDFIYVNSEWNLPILGTYKLYSDASDHSPIIVDFYFDKTK